MQNGMASLKSGKAESLLHPCGTLSVNIKKSASQGQTGRQNSGKNPGGMVDI